MYKIGIYVLGVAATWLAFFLVLEGKTSAAWLLRTMRAKGYLPRGEVAHVLAQPVYVPLAMRSLLVIAALALIVAAAWLETQAGLSWYDLTVFGMVSKLALFALAMGLYVIFAVWRASLR